MGPDNINRPGQNMICNRRLRLHNGNVDNRLLHLLLGQQLQQRIEIGVLAAGFVAMQQAEIMGRAMRFGAMFTLEKPLDHGKLKLFPKKGILELTLKTDTARDLFGEVAQARFKALAAAIGAEPVVKGIK